MTDYSGQKVKSAVLDSISEQVMTEIETLLLK